MGTFRDLRARVDANGGVLTVRMEELRDAAGYQRLGSRICEELSDMLGNEGLGHTPTEMSPDAWAPVRLYTVGSPVARIVRAVERPGDDGDATLRELASDEAGRVLQQVRTLVCP